MKLKIFAIYGVLAAVMIAIGICVFFFYFKKSKTESLEEKQEAVEVSHKQEPPIMLTLPQEASLESELNQLKAELSKTIEDQKSARRSYKNEDYTHIMLALSLVEAKLYKGGSVKNEIIRLKSLSSKHPELLLIIKNFEHISLLLSRKEMGKQYEDYVKIAKSELLSEQPSKLEKAMGFASKYFAILRHAKEEDKALIDIGEYLNNDDFIKAYEALYTLDIKSPEAQTFTDNLKNASLLQNGINDIYFVISSTISEGDNLGR